MGLRSLAQVLATALVPIPWWEQVSRIFPLIVLIQSFSALVLVAVTLAADNLHTQAVKVDELGRQQQISSITPSTANV